MRTTVVLDPDVAAKLQKMAKERGQSFKQVMNDTLRQGMSSSKAGDSRLYRLPARRMSLNPDVNLDKALRLAASIEDEEVIRKLELRK